MINLNVGNLWDDEFLDTVIKWNDEFKDKNIRVESLFGSIARLTPTARSADRIPFRNWDFIEEYTSKVMNNGMSIRYTLNHSCIGSLQDFKSSWENNLKNTLQKLHDAGVKEWTVTSPLLVELLREMFPSDFIEVSTIAEVSTPEEMQWWIDLGANGVNLSTSINRNPSKINQIMKLECTVSILANEACLFRCPWRRECYNLSSHDSFRLDALFKSYPFQRCNEIRLEAPEEWIKSRLLLPQWLFEYQAAFGVNWFKVAFRTHPKEVALPILRLYMEQDFHGNLLDLWPTIAQLGHTVEPRDHTYISADKMDSCLNYFMVNGHKCDDHACFECGICASMLEAPQA